jgi:hypothetical protein
VKFRRFIFLDINLAISENHTKHTNPFCGDAKLCYVRQVPNAEPLGFERLILKKPANCKKLY